jgi:hypothetical protein
MFFMSSTNYSCQILIKLEFSRQIFEKKISNDICHENPTSDSRVVPREQTDGQTSRSKCLFSQFLNAPKNKGKISRSVCDTLTLTVRFTTHVSKTALSISTGLKKIRRELKFAMTSCPWA